MAASPSPSRLFCFGLGYTAKALLDRLMPLGWNAAGTGRGEKAAGACPVHAFDGTAPMAKAADRLAGTTHLLISIPPDAEGCLVLRHHMADIQALPGLQWVGYLSTTGVYGDHQGAWVDETTLPNPGQRRSIQRLAAERQWLASGLPVEIFRLAGIYGPGRSAFDKLRSGSARRIVKPGHLFSRIHVQDIATVLMASITRPDPGAIYNVCDDEPSEQGNVLIEAARLLGIDPPPPIPFAEADLSPMAASFYAESRLVRNDRMKQALGVTLSYPSYREGLRAILESENRKA